MGKNAQRRKKEKEMQQQQKQVQVKIDLNTLESLACPDCGNFNFIPVLQIKWIPALLAPTGTLSLMERPMYRQCTECHKLIDPQAMVDDRAKNPPPGPPRIILPAGVTGN